MPGDIFVYALCDPRTNEIRYVGQTVKGMKRPWQHWQSHAFKTDRNNKKKGWIKQLKKANIKYEVEILQECKNTEELDEAEMFWISYLRFIGCRLVNLSEGGCGERPLNGRSQKTKAHLSKVLGGRPIQDELGNVYVSKNEAARKLNIARQAITRVLKGKDNHAGGHTFGYVGDLAPRKYIPEEHPRKESLTRALNISKALGGRPFRDQFGNIYQTQVEASDKLGCSTGAISRILKKDKHRTIYGYTFAYLGEEFQELTRPNKQIRKKLNNPYASRLKISLGHGSKPFKDQNGKIYYMLRDACESLDLGPVPVQRVLDGKKEEYRGYKFFYLEGEELNKIINEMKAIVKAFDENPNKPKLSGDYGKKLIDQNGRIYPNSIEASKETGIPRRTLIRMLKDQKARNGWLLKYLAC